jgi:hypothetical protein
VEINDSALAVFIIDEANHDSPAGARAPLAKTVVREYSGRANRLRSGRSLYQYGIGRYSRVAMVKAREELAQHQGDRAQK